MCSFRRLPAQTSVAGMSTEGKRVARSSHFAHTFLSFSLFGHRPSTTPWRLPSTTGRRLAPKPPLHQSSQSRQIVLDSLSDCDDEDGINDWWIKSLEAEPCAHDPRDEGLNTTNIVNFTTSSTPSTSSPPSPTSCATNSSPRRQSNMSATTPSSPAPTPGLVRRPAVLTMEDLVLPRRGHPRHALLRRQLPQGPGCSSIAYGLVEEVGPFHVIAGGKGLYYNKYSWNRVANLLFLESPAGVGFSYSNNHSNDMLNNGDASAANENLIFLEKWFMRFPQFNGQDFYLIGESYAGHYIPQLAQAIVRSFELTGERWINLKGYLVGNALTDDLHDHQGAIEFLWSAGIISDQTYKLLHSSCDYVSSMHPSSECERIFDIASEEIGNIDHYSIFVPTCTSSIASTRSKLLKRLSMGKMSEEFDPCTGNYSKAYFNLPEVQDALHAKPSKWKTCSYTMRDNWKDSPVSVLPIVKELIDYGLRIWMYNGDVDAVVPVASTRSTINALQLPIATPWHAWYDDGQVGGRTQVYKGLTFVTVRGAGHEIPLLRPKQALVLFKQFLSDSPMPTLSEHESS